MVHLFVKGGASGIQVMGSKSWVGNGAQLAQIQIPDEASPGDYLICALVARGWSTNTAGPTGWTTLTSVVIGSTRMLFYGKELQAGDVPQSISFVGSVTIALTIALRGINNAAPINAQASGSGTATSSITAPTTTTTVPKCLVLRSGWTYNSANINPPVQSWAVPLAGVGHGISGNSCYIGIGGEIQDAATATGTQVATNSPNAVGGGWITLAIAPAP